MASCIFQAKSAVNQIRWGSIGDPLNGLTITWSNNGAADSIKWGYTSSFEKGPFIGAKRSGYASGSSFFKYVFPTVNPSAALYYEIYDSGTHNWGTQQIFTTSQAINSTTFSFAALGDCRDYPATLTTISNLVSARKPALTLFNGDLTANGNSTPQYNTFFSAASNFLANNLVYHAEGNHDASSPSLFSNLWDLPVTNGTNLHYAIRYGNAIFITINSCDPSNSTQLSWLKTTLAAAAADPTIIWKIISCHHPFFTIGQHSGDMDSYRSSIWKAFDDYGVDVIFNGHDHCYERSKPINLNVSSNTAVTKYGSAKGEGRCEIVSGGAGAGLYKQGSSQDAWAMNLFNSTYNYVYCDIKDCKLTITAYSQSNTIIDSFTLDKSSSSGCTTGVAEVSEKFNPISVFPNPTTNTFTLNYTSDLTGEAIIKIFDMTGQEIAREKTSKTGNTMTFKYDLSKHVKGIYVISVIMGDQKDNATLILK